MAQQCTKTQNWPYLPQNLISAVRISNLLGIPAILVCHPSVSQFCIIGTTFGSCPGSNTWTSFNVFVKSVDSNPWPASQSLGTHTILPLTCSFLLWFAVLQTSQKIFSCNTVTVCSSSAILSISAQCPPTDTSRRQFCSFGHQCILSQFKMLLHLMECLWNRVEMVSILLSICQSFSRCPNQVQST